MKWPWTKTNEDRRDTPQAEWREFMESISDHHLKRIKTGYFDDSYIKLHKKDPDDKEGWCQEALGRLEHIARQGAFDDFNI